LADLAHLRAQCLPAVGDEHDLRVVVHEGDADDRAVALARVDQDDALAAAVLRAEFGEGRAFAVALLADGEHLGLAVARHAEPDDAVPLGEIDAAHADGGASHRAYLLLVEADGHALLRGDDDVARAVGDGGGKELVAVFDLDADDALLAEVLVFG